MGEDPRGFAAGDGNLSRYVGNSPTHATDPSGMVEQWHWHHRLPQGAGLRERFQNLGIEIDSAEYGILLERAEHAKLNGHWVAEWKKFFATNEDRSKNAVLRHLADLEDNDQYKRILATGKKATISYGEWQKISAEVNKAIEVARLTGKGRMSVTRIVNAATKATKVVGAVTFVYVAATDSVTVAAEGASRDALYPYLDIAEAAASQIGEVSDSVFREAESKRRVRDANNQRFLNDPVHGEIPRGPLSPRSWRK